MAEQKPNVDDTIREWAEKAVQGLKTFGTNVADASKELVQSAKTNSELSDIEKDIKQAFCELGELAYRSSGLTGDMKKVADRIHALYARKQELAIAANKADQHLSGKEHKTDDKKDAQSSQSSGNA